MRKIWKLNRGRSAASQRMTECNPVPEDQVGMTDKRQQPDRASKVKGQRFKEDEVRSLGQGANLNGRVLGASSFMAVVQAERDG